MAVNSVGFWVIVVSCAAGRIAAQEAVFLSPAKYTAQVGEQVALSMKQQGADVAWDDAQVAWSMVRVAGTQENADRAPRAGEDAPTGTVRLVTSGAAVVGVDFKPRTVALDAAAVKALVEGAGRNALGGNFPQAGARVHVVQSAKTVLRVGETEPGQSPNVTAKTGQQVELRPTFDPTGIGIGSDIPVVVYAGNGKAPGAMLVATHVGTGERQEFVTNASAIGSFRLSRAGEWRVEFRQLVEAKEKKDGEPGWVLYAATLTFEAPEAKGHIK